MNYSLIDINHYLPSAFIEQADRYVVKRALTENEIIQAAKFILAKRFSKGKIIDSAKKMQNFFVIHLAPVEYEVFCVAFLTTQNNLIACDQMFRGSICSSFVYPREVVKRALELNAAKVVLAHNHPSGTADVSLPDRHLTQRLRTTLALVEIEVLDHIIVGSGSVVSFAELGLL